MRGQQSKAPGFAGGWLLSAALSLGAAVMALYLVPLSGKARAWLLFSAAFVLLSTERSSELLSHSGMLFDVHIQEVISDILLTAVTVCLLGGIHFVRRLFLERNMEKRMLEQRLDELQRFQRATIGRELRTKELYEENQVLKAQVGEPGT